MYINVAERTLGNKKQFFFNKIETMKIFSCIANNLSSQHPFHFSLFSSVTMQYINLLLIFSLFNDFFFLYFTLAVSLGFDSLPE